VTTIRIGGAGFKVFPQDHTPRHVHGLYQGIEVIFDLNEDATVAVANRKNAVQPRTAKRSQVRHILNLAADNFESLVAIWESMHR